MREENRTAVIVVTYNRKRLLKRCLDSLLSQTVEIVKIVVVDNASTDGTPEMIENYREANPTKICYLRLPENSGGSGGFYAGFAYLLPRSDWNWLMVMDDDAAPEQKYTEKLLEQANRNSEVRCLIGTEYVGDTDRIAYGGRRLLDKMSTMRTRIVPEAFYEKECFDVDAAVFVGLMMHRSAVEKAGCPDRDFFIYYDDTDYCFRLRRFTRILHVTGARIVHRESFERDVMVQGRKLWRLYYLYRNELAIKKRFIKNPFLRYGWIFKNYIRKILEIVTTKDRKGRRMWLATRATVDVLIGRMGKAEYIGDE